MRSILGPVILAALLAGCTPEVTRVGSAPANWPAAGDRSFMLAAAPPKQDRFSASASIAVREALIERGFREADDARYRVEIGFASNGKRIALVEPDARAAAGQGDIALCKRRRYALSVTMIDRHDGQALFRATASAIGCRGAAEFMPMLVKAALNPA